MVLIIKILPGFRGAGCGLDAAMETAQQLAGSLKIQRESGKLGVEREREEERERSDARTQTNLCVSIAVSHRQEDK